MVERSHLGDAVATANSVVVSITPSAKKVLLATVFSRANTAAAPVHEITGGVDWTKIITGARFVANGVRLSTWHAKTGDTAPGAVTVTATAAEPTTSMAITIEEFSNASASFANFSPVATSAAGDPRATLPSAVSANDSIVFGAFACLGGETIASPLGFSTLPLLSPSGMRGQTSICAKPATGQVGGWTSTNAESVAALVEIKAAEDEEPPPPPPSSPYVKVAPTIGLSRPASQIVRPAFKATTPNNYTYGAPNITCDMRGRCGKQHNPAGQAHNTVYRPTSCGPGLITVGGEVVGMQSDSMSWDEMHGGPTKGAQQNDWDDNGCDTIDPSGEHTWENMRFEKCWDAINGYGGHKGDTGNHKLIVRGCYFREIRDECVENDHLKPMLYEDCLVDSTHQWISQRPDASDPNKTTKNVAVIRNALVRLRRQPYTVDGRGDAPNAGSKFDGPWNSAADPGKPISGKGYGFCCGWLFKHLSGSMRVEMSDCLFLIESLATGGQSLSKWPGGTYKNVKILYVGPGAWPVLDTTPAGVDIEKTQDIREWTDARSEWLTAHGCKDGKGDDFTFLHGA